MLGGVQLQLKLLAGFKIINVLVKHKTKVQLILLKLILSLLLLGCQLSETIIEQLL